MVSPAPGTNAQLVNIDAKGDVRDVSIVHEIGQYFEPPDVLVREIGRRYCLINRGNWLERFSELRQEGQKNITTKPTIAFFTGSRGDRPDLLLSRLTTFGWGLGQVAPMSDVLQTDAISRTRTAWRDGLTQEELITKLAREFSASDQETDEAIKMPSAPLRIWLQVPSSEWDRKTQEILRLGVIAFQRLAQERGCEDALLMCCLQMRGFWAKRRAKKFVSFWHGIRDENEAAIGFHNLNQLTAITEDEALFWASKHLDQSMHATMCNAVAKCYRRFGFDFFARKSMSLADLTAKIDTFRRKGWFTGS